MNLPSKYVENLKYVTPCPDQKQGRWNTNSYSNCGSCLYMSITGSMEMLMNKGLGLQGNRCEGFNLSERWMMNIETPRSMVQNGYNSFRDRMLVYNHYGRTMLERDYPFTKSKLGGKRFNVRCNWSKNIPKNWRKMSIPVPKIRRKVLFGKLTKESCYDVAVLNDSHIEKIKSSLVRYDGPVLVIYNGEETWHAVLIVGYDDSEYIGECKYIKQMLNFKELNLKHRNEVRESIRRQGGYRKRGVFYVRESEYYPFPKGFYGKSEFLYDYGLGDDKVKYWQPYVAPYCKRSYDWMKYVGNNAIVIYRDPNDR